MSFQAYGYTVRDLRLQWKNERDEEGKIKEAVQVAECKLSQFKFIDHKTDSYELKFSTGTYIDQKLLKTLLRAFPTFVTLSQESWFKMKLAVLIQMRLNMFIN